MSIGAVLAGAITGKMQYDQQKYYKEKQKKRDALAEKQLDNTKKMNERLTKLLNPDNAKEVTPTDDSDYTKFSPQDMPKTAASTPIFEKQASYASYASGQKELAEGGVVGYMYGGMVGSQNKKSYYAHGGEIGHKTIKASGYYHGGIDECSDRMMWQKENFKK